MGFFDRFSRKKSKDNNSLGIEFANDFKIKYDNYDGYNVKDKKNLLNILNKWQRKCPDDANRGLAQVIFFSEIDYILSFEKLEPVYIKATEELSPLDPSLYDWYKNKAYDCLMSKKGNMQSQEKETLNSEESTEFPVEKSIPDNIIKNFKWLDDLIHSGKKEIVLDHDVVLDYGEEDKYFEGIRLDIDDLIIDGNNHSIDACGKTRIFVCCGENITIKNVNLKNGFYEVRGGAIYNNNVLTIEKSTLTDNVSEYGGGAIYNENGILTVVKSIFNKNTTRSSGGGAIFNNDGKLSVTKSFFNENTSKGKGGAIYNLNKIVQEKLDEWEENFDGVIYNPDSISSIIGSEFNNNCAGDGGAIYNVDAKLEVSDSILNENKVKGHGGAIRNEKGDFTLSKSKLIKNEANGKHVSDGGAIDNDKGKFTISDSILNENSSKMTGIIRNSRGYLKMLDCKISKNNSYEYIICNSNYTSGLITAFNSLEIQNCIFEENYSSRVIVNSDEKSNLGIFYGEFIENNIEESIIYNEGKSCIINKTVFKSNNDLSNIIINKSDLTLINPKLNDKTLLNEGHVLIKKSPQDLENKIVGEGTIEVDTNIIPHEQNFDFGYLDKKIHESDTKEIILDEDICLETYESDFYEGGIELDIDGLVIDGNGKTIDGKDESRIFIVTGDNITLRNITFKNGCSYHSYNNKLNNHGGVIRLNYKNKLTIENCKFINNSSEENGGAIYNRGMLTLSESEFNNNKAKSGGAIYVEYNELTIENSLITENQVKNMGGAIYNNALLRIKKSTISENMSKSFGGGAIHNTGVLTIDESRLNNNKTTTPYADYGGGSIENDGGELTIADSDFIRNEGSRGGAIFNSNDGKLTIENSLIAENSGNSGGALFNNEKGALTVSKSVLSENIADFGGAIFNDGGGRLTISQSLLNKNKTKRYHGGAIFNKDCMLIISETTISENIADRDGGAIFCKVKERLQLDNCIFKDNKPNDVSEP